MKSRGIDMWKLSKVVKSITIALFLLYTLGCKQEVKDRPIIIAAASNIQYALKELVAEFEKTTAIDCELVISSSGKLTAQIIEGAPFDIFLSADMKYPARIEAAGLAVENPRIYAQGKLVLWTVQENLMPSLNILNNPSIHHIAIANPKTAPYGKAALEVLSRIGILDRIEPKMVYGESISQTNRFVTSGSAQLGFTAKAVVLTPALKHEGNWTEVDAKYYEPINQGVVIIKGDNKQIEKSKKFFNFLFSAPAQKVLKDFGYSVSE